MKPVKGYSTLLITTFILLIVLVVSLSAYRSILQYARLAEHRLIQLTNQWQAEGAIECVFAKSKVGSVFPLDVSECAEDVDELTVTGKLIQRVHALSGFSALTKQFILPAPDTSGAIKTSANLVLTFASHFDPDPGELDENLDWQCVAIRYKHRLTAPSLTTRHPYQMNIFPYSGFPDSTEQLQRCADDHYSFATDAGHAKSDYLHDKNLDPFLDLFGVPSSQWFSVMMSPAVGRISSGTTPDNSLSYDRVEKMPEAEFVSNCAEQVVARIHQGKDLIWVYGGCELNEGDVSQINLAIEAEFSRSGIILVVQNGLLAVKSNQVFHGMLMQFTSPESGLVRLSDWSKTSVSEPVKQFISLSAQPDLVDMAQISYFQIGRFNPLGGLVISSDNTYAVIEGRLHFRFQRDLITQALRHIRPVHWISGSWEDGVFSY